MVFYLLAVVEIATEIMNVIMRTIYQNIIVGWDPGIALNFSTWGQGCGWGDLKPHKLGFGPPLHLQVGLRDFFSHETLVAYDVSIDLMFLLSSWMRIPQSKSATGALAATAQLMVEKCSFMFGIDLYVQNKDADLFYSFEATRLCATTMLAIKYIANYIDLLG